MFFYNGWKLMNDDRWKMDVHEWWTKLYEI